MNAILITKCGGIYSIPEFRRLAINTENLVEALQENVSFVPKPVFTNFSENCIGCFFQNSLLLFQTFSGKSSLKAKFLVKPISGNSTILELASSVSEDRSSNFTAILPFSIPQNITLVLIGIQHHQVSLSPECFCFWLNKTQLYNSMMPNVYDSGLICMGNLSDFTKRLQQNFSLLPTVYFQENVFDNTCLVYAKPPFNKFWTWDVSNSENPQFLGPTTFSEERLLKYKFPEDGELVSLNILRNCWEAYLEHFKELKTLKKIEDKL